MSGEILNIETRYSILPFIGMHSKVTQNIVEKLCKRLRHNVKVFTSNNVTYNNFYPSRVAKWVRALQSELEDPGSKPARYSDGLRDVTSLQDSNDLRIEFVQT